MKVFVLKRDSVFLYILMLSAVFGIYRAGMHYSDAALTSAGIVRSIPVYCVDTNEKKIALTFDAAWDDSDTDELISVLDQNDVKASFFVVGGWVDRYPHSVKKFHEAGHEILNHSDAHLHMNNLSDVEISADLALCEEKIKTVTGESKMLFRPPYGEYNDTVVNSARSSGYEVIQWDCDSLDWKDLSADEIEKRVMSKVKNGSIILMHNGAKNTPEALAQILPKLKEKGYSFEKVSELIYKDNYKIDHSGKQIKLN